MTRKAAVRVTCLVLAVSLASACAGPGGEGTAMPQTTPTPSGGQTPTGASTGAPTETQTAPPPLSSTRLPTRGPQKPPKTPSDLVPHDIVLGRVTKGGSGPCYGLVDDDGVEYALHNTAGITLEEDTYVRAKVAPLRLKIDCGPGIHLALLNATKL